MALFYDSAVPASIKTSILSKGFNDSLFNNLLCKGNYVVYFFMVAKGIEKEIEYITHEIVQKYQPQKVILFGSTEGSFNKDNDLDFFIVKDESRTG